MRENDMVTMFRLNAEESEKLRRLAIEVNKKRIERGREPVKDSELLHEILEEVFKVIVISTRGNILITI